MKQLIWIASLFAFAGTARADLWDNKDRVDVGKKEGSFTRMAFVVLDNEIELIDVDVEFGNGDHWHPDLKHYFKEGSRSRELDFPGNKRYVKHIDFKYRNVPDGKHAK